MLPILGEKLRCSCSELKEIQCEPDDADLDSGGRLRIHGVSQAWTCSNAVYMSYIGPRQGRIRKVEGSNSNAIIVLFKSIYPSSARFKEHSFQASVSLLPTLCEWQRMWRERFSLPCRDLCAIGAEDRVVPATKSILAGRTCERRVSRPRYHGPGSLFIEFQSLSLKLRRKIGKKVSVNRGEHWVLFVEAGEIKLLVEHEDIALRSGLVPNDFACHRRGRVALRHRGQPCG